MRKLLVRTGVALLAIFIILQFIRPTPNVSEGPFPYEIAVKYTVPSDVRLMLQTSCYNCHSNHTNYPWYAYVQPVGWFLDNHIQKGKAELNFSEFALYPARRQMIKARQIADEVNEDKMPLRDYVRLHPEAVLTEVQKQRLTAWTQVLQDTIRAMYPRDSLVRR